MRKFGLIGQKLSHSFSKNYFKEKFNSNNISDCEYELYEMDNLTNLRQFIQNIPTLEGLNVTIPFKESVVQFLDEIDPIAKAVGAVNVIKIIRGKEIKLIGYNTDVIGFKLSLRPFLAIGHERALILGSGGASKAVDYVFKELSIPSFICSRKTSNETNVIGYEDIDAAAISRIPIIVNCTPIGMYPNENEIPAIPTDSIGRNHLVYDLIYNPLESRLLAIAKKQGAETCNGLNMLKIQAEESWKIWNP